MKLSEQYSGQLVDIFAKRIYPATVFLKDKKIEKIEEVKTAPNQFILPGFVDAHVHIESSMLTPHEFSRLALVHGTVATVSDPHEIGNVLGVEGVEYMIQNAELSPLKFHFGAPSCVPATTFETAGATICLADIEYLFEKYGLVYLSEMMNYPGVLFRDPLVMDKIALAQKYGKVVDGHAPGLRGEEAKKYIEAGISTDHECFTIEEALDKLKHGMKIIIREGSAAKNFEALIPLMKDYAEMLMFCSDDKHPNDLVEGHINQLVLRALEKGHDLFSVLKCACINPVQHYGMDVGLLKEGDPADFIIVNNLEEFKVLETVIGGACVAKEGKALLEFKEGKIVNNFDCSPKQVKDFIIEAKGSKLRVIEALDGQLITNEVHFETLIDEKGNACSDKENDILKMTVVNRYKNAEPALAFIKNFGLKEGALASSVGHDSHNIIAVGTTDEDLCLAVNALIDAKGGLAVVKDGKASVLALPVAGILSPGNGFKVAEQYTKLDAMAKELGSKLHAPFMTLSFMALLVIPDLKLSDLGLFSGNKFQFSELFLENSKLS